MKLIVDKGATFCSYVATLCSFLYMYVAMSAEINET